MQIVGVPVVEREDHAAAMRWLSLRYPFGEPRDMKVAAQQIELLSKMLWRDGEKLRIRVQLDDTMVTEYYSAWTEPAYPSLDST